MKMYIFFEYMYLFISLFIWLYFCFNLLLVVQLRIINDVLFPSVRFDSDASSKEAAGTISSEGPRPASKPYKGAKAQDVSVFFLNCFTKHPFHPACVCIRVKKSWQNSSSWCGSSCPT